MMLLAFIFEQPSYKSDYELLCIVINDIIRSVLLDILSSVLTTTKGDVSVLIVCVLNRSNTVYQPVSGSNRLVHKYLVNEMNTDS